MTHQQPTTSRANPQIIEMWATKKKCWMCRHRFENPVILPVDTPEHDKFQPKINTEVLWHLQDTHGLPHQTVREWVIGSVYGWELNEVGIKGAPHEDY